MAIASMSVSVRGLLVSILDLVQSGGEACQRLNLPKGTVQVFYAGSLRERGDRLGEREFLLWGEGLLCELFQVPSHKLPIVTQPTCAKWRSCERKLISSDAPAFNTVNHPIESFVQTFFVAHERRDLAEFLLVHLVVLPWQRVQMKFGKLLINLVTLLVPTRLAGPLG